MTSKSEYSTKMKRVSAVFKGWDVATRQTIVEKAKVTKHAIDRMLRDGFLTSSINENRRWIILSKTLRKQADNWGMLKVRKKKYSREFAIFSKKRTTKKTLSFLASRRPWGITPAEAEDMLGLDCRRQLRELEDKGRIQCRTVNGEKLYLNRVHKLATRQVNHRRTNPRFKQDEDENLDIAPDVNDEPLTIEELSETLDELIDASDVPVGSTKERFIANTMMILTNRSFRTLELWVRHNPRISKAIGMDDIVPDHTTLNRAFNATSPDLIFDLFHRMIKRLRGHGVITGKFLVVDATHVQAWYNTRRDTNEHPLEGAEWGDHHGSFFGYKVHIVIDAESEIPIAMTITSGRPHDSTEFIPLVEQVEAEYDFDEVIAILADAGYDDGSYRDVVRSKFGSSFLHACNPRNSKILKSMKREVKNLFDRFGDKIGSVQDALGYLKQRFFPDWDAKPDIRSMRGNRIVMMIEERLHRPMRAGVERAFSRLRALASFDRPKVRPFETVNKTLWWCLLCQTLVAYTCVSRGTPEQMRRRNIIV